MRGVRTLACSGRGPGVTLPALPSAWGDLGGPSSHFVLPVQTGGLPPLPCVLGYLRSALEGI